jgi:3-oxoacyl-[acyl-carrier protein] reductase
VGFEIAKYFATRGAVVIVCSRIIGTAQESISVIMGKAYPERLDLIDLLDMSGFMRRMADRHGSIITFVNNAGYPFDRKRWNNRFHKLAQEEFDKVIEVDLKGTVRLSQGAILYMIRNVKSCGGVIINIVSRPAIAGHTAGDLYSIAKSGVIAITKHIALKYGDKNILLYTYALGNISTQATFASTTATERKKTAMANSMKTWGDLIEVPTSAANAASEDYTSATGNTMIIVGGSAML